jgi:hypothetical protein
MGSPIRPAPRRRPRGRPASKKDKNRRPVPVRADRDRFIQWFFEEVPRTGLDDAMLMSGDKRFHRLYDALHDDVYRRTSPGTLCRRFNVTWLDLVQLWFSYNIHLGLMQLANHLPKILTDMAEDSESRDGPCPVCDGMGYVATDSSRYTCVECDGAGKVRVPGDEHARRLLFKIIGLMGPRRQQVEQAPRPSLPARPSG